MIDNGRVADARRGLIVSAATGIAHLHAFGQQIDFISRGRRPLPCAKSARWTARRNSIGAARYE
jgi:hypothetical protein